MDNDNMLQFIPDEELKGEDVITQLSESMDWGEALSSISELWSCSKGSGINVAVLDTGIYNHVDLEGQIIGRYDSTGSGTDPSADHGTHVAGIIAAKQNDIGIIGVAPEAKLFSVKVLGPGGKGSFDTVLGGLKICENLDCKIINMSLGIPVEPPKEVHEQIQKLFHQGKFIISAAGNSASSVNWPAAYPEVIAVGAIDPNQALAKFSSRGPETDVVAPGTDIYSCWGTNDYKRVSGTSQAAPFFSGVCAVLLSCARDNPDKLKIDNFDDLLKLLDVMCDPNINQPYAGTLSGVGFGIPHFANNLPWRTNNVDT